MGIGGGYPQACTSLDHWSSHFLYLIIHTGRGRSDHRLFATWLDFAFWRYGSGKKVPFLFKYWSVGDSLVSNTGRSSFTLISPRDYPTPRKLQKDTTAGQFDMCRLRAQADTIILLLAIYFLLFRVRKRRMARETDQEESQNRFLWEPSSASNQRVRWWRGTFNEILRAVRSMLPFFSCTYILFTFSLPTYRQVLLCTYLTVSLFFLYICLTTFLAHGRFYLAFPFFTNDFLTSSSSFYHT